jgi:hypothetical protein
MRTPFVLLCLCVLPGCAGTINPTQLEPPAAILMKPPANLPALKAGDDLVHEHARLRRMYSSETDRQRRLQKWAKTVLQKK